jgi:protein-disulfide isomerase
MKKFIPTMVVEKIKENSPEGKKLISEYDLKTIPAFVFDPKIQDSKFFNEEQVKEIFEKRGRNFVLSASSLGVPVGKYLEAPSKKEGDIIVGNPDAQVKIITFFDFQCPYCKIFYDALKKARGEFLEEELVLIFKTFPLDMYGQSVSATLVGQCAYQQGRFEKMADILFEKQEEWSMSEDFKFFDQYAASIGLDMKKFDECVNSSETQNLIQESIEQANAFGVNNTPSSFIGKELLDDLFQKEDIVEEVNKRLK